MNNKGITIVTLVITIVVIIILAGTSIVLINNSNLISKTVDAGKDYSEKEIEEKLDFLFANYKAAEMSNRKYDKEYFINQILDVFNYQHLEEYSTGKYVIENVTITYPIDENDESGITLEYNGKKYSTMDN